MIGFRSKMFNEYLNGLLFFLLIFLNFSASSKKDFFTTPCSFEKRCSCSSFNTEKKVDCSGQGLNTIPTLPKNVTWINLSNNNIASINRHFPRTTVGLDLSYNKINNLQNSPFEGLINLEVLDLQFNQIYYLNSTNSTHLFRSLVSLRQINLKHNSLLHNMDWYPLELIGKLQSLESLKIDVSQKITVFGKHFLNLTHFQVLDVSGNTGYCDLYHIRRNLFQNLRYLRILDISACGVKFVEPGTLGNMPNLQFLDVSYNKELGFVQLPNLFEGIQNTQIHSINIDGIHCLMGTGTTLHSWYLEKLKYTNLTTLSVAGNRLEWIDSDVIQILPKSLAKLNLANNRVTTGPVMLLMNLMTGLRVFNFTLQLHPPSIEEKIFEHCHENIDPNFSITQDVNSDVNFTNNDEEQIQRLSSPSSKKIMDQHTTLYEMFEGKKIVTLALPPKLEVLYWNSSRLFGEIPTFGVKAPNANFLYLQDNICYSWIGPMYGLDNLTYLDLSNNFCSYVSNNFFKTLRGLQILNISHNAIGRVIEADTSGELFNNQFELRKLDVSFNGITKIPRFIFKNMKYIESINLSHNRITRWRVKTGHMKYLKMLDLSGNSINTVEYVEMMEMQSLFTENATVVDFTGNRFLCSCENLKFLQWMSTFRYNFKNIKNYLCSDKSPVEFTFHDIVASVENLQQSCQSYLAWYITVSISVTFFLTGVVSVIIFKNRWKIRYLWYAERKTKNGYKPLHVYDAYISYCLESSKDQKFIKNKLVPGLRDLSLFIMDRDAGVGQPKSDVIMGNLQASKRVICIVSGSYLTTKEQKWLRFEYEMAKEHAIGAKMKDNFIFLILMPEVLNTRILWRKLENEMKKKYYIEYPDDKHGDRVFMDELKRMITQ